MATGLREKSSIIAYPRIECGNCAQSLPLRLAGDDEQPSAWQCARCNKSYSAICLKDKLIKSSNAVRFDQRYFNTTSCTPFSNKLRQQATELANGPVSQADKIKRRSVREKKSLLTTGITLCPNLTPIGVPLQLLVVNLSKEGVGLASTSAIFAPYLALLLPYNGKSSIQVIVRIVRERILELPLREYGTELFLRLGKQAS